LIGVTHQGYFCVWRRVFWLEQAKTGRRPTARSIIHALLVYGMVSRGGGYDTITPMSDFKPRPGTFLPYMEAMRKSAKPAKASPITLLEVLARQAQQSLPMFDLQAQSGMEPARYAEALKGLRDAGYIAIDVEALDQAVRLTESGGKVVDLARPA
jgi:hypothetical protein